MTNGSCLHRWGREACWENAHFHIITLLLSLSRLKFPLSTSIALFFSLPCPLSLLLYSLSVLTQLREFLLLAASGQQRHVILIFIFLICRALKVLDSIKCPSSDWLVETRGFQWKATGFIEIKMILIYFLYTFSLWLLTFWL